MRKTVYSYLFFYLTAHLAVSAFLPARLTVHVFLNTECPISQQYTRRLNELYRQFTPQGVKFIAYYPLKTDNRQAIKKFQQEYAFEIPGLPDTQQKLAHQLRAQITPEVVLQTSSGIILYQGAIDNWYVDLGRHRPEATEHYLHDALEKALANKPISITKTQAVGCLID